ncbi:ADAMTS-like protein 1 [Larimichthys crocea]|uniref:ADAMTS-like protein 1 n=1 Tax=Larimichthys crocea TaxID=215358 RepID=A0A6G0HJ71_LARCR|nr:ADAMTS-like protein 1 [Larimichthys crocea]
MTRTTPALSGAKPRALGLVVELAPKVLDGTRCYTESLDMCISGVCQIVGCDHELGSTAKEDNCGICNGDGSSCRLVRGHYKSQHASGKTEDTVVIIPYKSRHVRLVLKGPDHLYVESKTLQGVKGELVLDKSGQYHLENTSLDFQKLSDKEVLRITGPLGADFTVKVQFVSGADSVAQYIYYQPIIHRWRETDFFPCSVTCGGGYQLTSAECFDLRSGRVVVDQYCHYYPENIKPKPKLQECNMEPCLAGDGYKQIMPYDLYHPLPRWESSPWTACSTSCGGGIQSRSCTVTCGQGLRYRVVLCIDHRGLHAGGCNPTTKPHIKEECLVTVPCYKSIETLPVEAKPVWHKQAIELEEEIIVTEEPAFIPGPWQTCSRTCGAGTQQRTVKCQVLLSFSQTVADLPDDECEGVKPATSQPCYRTPCSGVLGRGKESEKEGEEVEEEDEKEETPEREELHDWEYEGFTECSESCGGGVQEAVVICLNKQTREAADQSLCVSSRRPPQLLQDCKTQPCPPRWETGEWSSCSATCGVGLMTRTVVCTHRPTRDSNRTEVLRDGDCQNPKPTPVQACNRFDCPPMWDSRDWGQCSRTCGGGFQRRQILCKQRLADGSILELPDTFCPSKSPANRQPCAKQECPPQWVTTDWSQCSVTCGNGIQRLQSVCRKQGEDGGHWTVNPENCSLMARPTRIRPCSLRHCENSAKPDPTILAQRKVYIQWRKGKKLHLVVGGYAYLLPWTTVVLRCPNSPLSQRPNSVVEGRKALGPAQEHFVLQIIGSKQKLSVPESWLFTDGQQKVGQPNVASTGERFQELPISLNQYDNIVEHLLELKGSLQDGKDIFDKPHSSEKNRSTLEDESSELSSLLVLIADIHRLDEITHNLSQGLRGPWREQLITQLLSELSVTQGETNESTLHPPESAESSTQGPLLYKPNIKAHTSRPRSPVIIQRARKVGAVPSSDMIVHMGVPILLQKPIASLELRCEALGNPIPSLTWTKNGKELNFNGRVGLLPTGSLRIQSPSKTDEGQYTCTARNRLGSSSLSSWLQVTGGVGRNCVQGNDMRANGRICSERSNNSQSELCHGQACPLRWRVDPWSPCSASCGGGSQIRSVRCMKGPEGRSKEMGNQHCLGTGRRPSDTRLCNQLPCARWATTHWGLCHGQCVGPSLATQHRHVFCQDTNGTKVPNRMCSGLQRPSSLRNCSTENCALHWHIGPWTQCTATCGRHGFQSRQVTCAHRRTGKATREHHCMWRPRPPSWQRCNILSCGRGECRDSTRVLRVSLIDELEGRIDSLLDILVCREVFTRDDREEVLSRSGPRARVRKVLDILECKGEEAATIFLSVSSHHQQEAQTNSKEGNTDQLQSVEYNKVKQKHKDVLRRRSESMLLYNTRHGEKILFSEHYVNLLLVDGHQGLDIKKHEVLTFGQNRLCLQQKSVVHRKITPAKLFSSTNGNSPVKKVLVTGVAGIGKTILVQKMLFDFGGTRDNLAFDFIIHMTFRDLNLIDKPTNLREMVLRKNRHLAKELDNILANEDKLLIILDGFDEFKHYRSCDVDVFVTEPDEDAEVVEVFGSLIQGELLPNASVMVTSRPAAINHIPVGCIDRFVLIAGFSLAEVQDFFLHYFQDSALADRMLAVVSENELMLTLCYIPAFCYIVCCLLKESKDLCRESPKTMTDIYMQYLVALLRSHTQTRAETFLQEQRSGATQQLSDIVLKLGRLAFQKLMEHQTLFYSSDLRCCSVRGM